MVRKAVTLTPDQRKTLQRLGSGNMKYGVPQLTRAMMAKLSKKVTPTET